MSSKQTSKPTLYYLLDSPPCQTVLVTARLSGIDLNIKYVDYLGNELNQEYYVKINPFRTVPTLVEEDGFVMHESRAIATYLLQSRCPDSPLYPQDIRKRATIDRILQYELGTLFPAIVDVIGPMFETGKIDSTRIPKLEKVFKIFNDYLKGIGPGKYITGDTQLSVADISAYIHWRVLELTPDIGTTQYAAVLEWAKLVKEALAPANLNELLDQSRDAMKKFIEAVKCKVNA